MKKRIYISIYRIYLACLLAVILPTSCEDFIDIPPPETSLVQELVFSDDATAIAATSGIYIQLSQGLSFASGSSQSISALAGLYADEIVSYSSTTSGSSSTPFYFNELIPTNPFVVAMWSNGYGVIYQANRVIEGVSASTQISHSVKSQLIGEGLFIRAFCHFYLLNLFGNVPLITTSDYRINASISRSSIDDVYRQIVEDLVKAKELMSGSYPSSGRVRPNKWAASALLSRVYLFTEEWTKAEEEATQIINNNSQYNLLSDVNAVFLKNSAEAIWQIIPDGGTARNTYEGALFILLAPPVGKVALNESLYNSMDDNDLRKLNWISAYTSASGNSTWHYAFKYKEYGANGTGEEYSMVLRLAEQFLIRAESRAQQNNLTGANSAETDINAIRNRANLPNTIASSKDDLLAVIMQERRAELFTEWGHRFFDLKRTEKLNEALESVKPNWSETDWLWPIPQSEILINPNLKPQNPGY